MNPLFIDEKMTASETFEKIKQKSSFNFLLYVWTPISYVS